MFGRILMTLGLAMLLAAPAHAGFGLVLPDSPIVDDPEKTSLNLVICAIDPATGAGIPIERPQVFTALREHRRRRLRRGRRGVRSGPCCLRCSAVP